jgi:uncharacterized membrane protein YdjX (TVP38/TMEM64 family)
MIGEIKNLAERKVLKKRILIALGAIILAAIFLSSLELQRVFYSSLQQVADFIEARKTLGILVFVFFGSVSVLLSPFSSVPLVPVAIQVFGTIPTIAFLVVSWMIGDIAAYFIGLSLIRAVTTRFVADEKVNFYRRKIPQGARFWFVLLFRLAIPAEITGYTLGAIKYQFRKYLLACFLSDVPFALLIVYSSEALIDKQFILFVSLAAFAVLFISVFFIILRRRLQQ